MNFIVDFVHIFLFFLNFFIINLFFLHCLPFHLVIYNNSLNKFENNKVCYYCYCCCCYNIIMKIIIIIITIVDVVE